jgi:predicted phosphodiesterase
MPANRSSRIFLNKGDLLSKTIRFIAWPDTHIPQQDTRAVDVAAQILEWWKPAELVILGDFLDCTPVSHWLRDRKKTTEGLRLRDDYNMANRLLDRLTRNLDHLVYLEGNHEDWIKDAIERNPEFEGLIELDLGLKFAERRERGLRITHLPYGKCYRLGELWFTHGVYTGVNHAKKHVDSFGRNVVYGHLHDVQMAVKVSPIDVEDKHMAMCMGSLCNKNPQFMENKPNNWVHAVGLGEVREDGSFNIYPVIICNGVASFAGQTFRSRVRA